MPEVGVVREQVVEYLTLLFGDACEGGYLFSTFALPSRDSAFHTSVESGVEWCVTKASSKEDVYCGMGLLDKPQREGRRGSAEDIAGIVGLWADVDISNPRAHKAKTYPVSLEEAMQVVEIVGHMTPTARVMSGYGIHAYWMFKEPWIFESPSERAEAAGVVMRWGETLKANARALGRSVDATFDLARVLRVAGTLNFKRDEPKQVILERMPEPGCGPFNLSDLEPFMVAHEYAAAPSTVVMSEVGLFRIDPDVTTDAGIIELLCQADEVFRETWTRTRTDLSDSSASSYDMALANRLVVAGWSDQRIVDALINWRRTHKETPKNRVDYYQRTIGKARSAIEQSTAVQDMAAGSPSLPAPEAKELYTPSDRQACLNALNACLRIRVKRFVQLNRDRSEYFLQLESGEMFSMGGVKKIMSFQSFRDRIVERCDIQIDPSVSKAWSEVVKRLLSILEHEEDLTPTNETRTKALIEEYLHTTKIYAEEEWAKAMREASPMVRRGRVWVHLETFVRWCRISMGERFGADQIRGDLKLMGMTPEKHQGRDRGVRRNRCYWGAPIDDFAEVNAKLGSKRVEPL